MKEGCPPSPLLICVVYELRHGTLSAEFPTVCFYTYLDDAASVSADRATTLNVLHPGTKLVDSAPTPLGTPKMDPLRQNITTHAHKMKYIPVVT